MDFEDQKTEINNFTQHYNKISFSKKEHFCLKAELKLITEKNESSTEVLTNTMTREKIY